MRKVALFGGSFNPPHIGHTLAVTYVLSQHVDDVLVVPAYKHAFGKDMVAYDHRIAMAQLSMGWLPNVTISSIEKELGKSRTLDTIEALYERYPDIKLCLVVGSDILLETDHWYRFDKIEELAQPIVLSRTGYDLLGCVKFPDVSSTRIRKAIKIKYDSGLKNLLTPDVLAYIEKHGLYKKD